MSMTIEKLSERLRRLTKKTEHNFASVCERLVKIETRIEELPSRGELGISTATRSPIDRV